MAKRGYRALGKDPKAKSWGKKIQKQRLREFKNQNNFTYTTLSPAEQDAFYVEIYRRYKMASDVVASTELTGLSLVVKMEPSERGEPGDDVILVIRTRKVTTGVNLSNLTANELLALREVVDYALRLSQPVAIERDQASGVGEDIENDFDEDVDFDWRYYRRVPEVLVAGGQNQENSTGIRLGSAWIQGVGSFIQRKIHHSRRYREGVAGRGSIRGQSPENHLA